MKIDQDGQQMNGRCGGSRRACEAATQIVEVQDEFGIERRRLESPFRGAHVVGFGRIPADAIGQPVAEDEPANDADSQTTKSIEMPIELLEPPRCGSRTAPTGRAETEIP